MVTASQVNNLKNLRYITALLKGCFLTTIDAELLLKTVYRDGINSTDF